MVSISKRKSERLNRRKTTLLNKAYELSEFCEVDVALILRIRKTGRYITYKSIDLESWPPSKDQIVISGSLSDWNYTKKAAANFLSASSKLASKRY